MSEQTTARWRGFTHDELYRMLNDGPGAGASAGPSRRWAELAAALDEVGHDLDSALSAAGSSWTGRAAGAAYDRLAPLGVWAKTTSENAAGMRVAVENQGDHIAKARADMPVPEDAPPIAPDPAVPPAVAVVAGADDAEPAETARSSAEQRAVEVMAAYEAGTTQNLAPLTVFPTPADLRRDGGVHRGRGEGVRRSTHVSGVPGHVPGVPDAGERHGSSTQPGVREGSNNNHGSAFTQSAGAPASATTSRPVPLAPGTHTGVAPVEHFNAGAPISTRGAPRDRERRPSPNSVAIGAEEADRLAGNNQASTGAVPPGAHLAPGSGAAPPMGGAGAAGGQADKLAMRRFGAEAIGSSQWFADSGDTTPVRAVSGRRRDLGDTENVTENVSVDGQDHHLPPPVIGG